MGLPETPAQLKRLPRVALPEGTLRDLVPEQPLNLSGEQRHYLQRVRRLRAGDEFLAFDGSGDLWQLQWQDDRAIAIVALDPQPRELPQPVRLVVGIPKHGFDDVVRQATELGVAAIEPMFTERTLVKPSANKVRRWQAIAREAAEQCERVYIPTIASPQAWSQRATAPVEECRCIAVARTDAPALSRSIAARVQTPIAIAIGPEGGWTEAEMTLAHSAGWQAVTLGPRVLRAVTAATFAVGAIAIALES